MLRRASWCLKLKRNKSPYVHKYLEGCPLPTTLVDDLAGANLKSSAPFFTTAPRYILAGTEKRLSGLFFHHALYPSGGARQPYRVVVVRGGRGVRSQSTAFALGQMSKNPARRPFFYARPKDTTETSEMSTGRAGVDHALAPLCGFVEEHFAEQMKECEATTDKEEEKEEEENKKNNNENQKRLWAEIEALLSGGPGGLFSAIQKSKSTGNSPTGSLLAQFLEQSVAGSAQESFVYVHTHLPSSAVSVSPVRRETQTSDISKTVDSVDSAQLVGGLEPVASFAVGSPVAVWCEKKREYMPFAHIQCLLRLSTRRSSHTKESNASTSSSSSLSSAQSHPSWPLGSRVSPVHRDNAEPWKLGTSLDPTVPFHVRTMTEVPGAATHFGRDDCETYIIPQRELLLCLHAPAEVVRQCAAQNDARRRRLQQQRGGGGGGAFGDYSSVPPAFADVPRNAQRVLDGQYRNNASAEEAAQSSTRKAVGDHVETEYKVRALPGDVVFVPRGWTYSVQRVVGVAIVHSTADTAEGKALSSLASSNDLRAAFATVPQGRPTLCESVSAAGDAPVRVTGVNVDAFVLCYKPYPVLSPEQAATYVAANYVHGGVDEFYANGGNSVYHKYT